MKATPKLAGAELRNAEKEQAALNRKLQKLSEQIDLLHYDLSVHDQSDYAGLASIGERVKKAEAEIATAEVRWLQLAELLG